MMLSLERRAIDTIIRVGSYERAVAPHSVRAVVHGADEELLLDLWTTLIDRGDPEAAIAFVATAYAKRTGKEPERPRH